MIDHWNRVLTNIEIAETGVCGTISSAESTLPASFPAILVDQLDDAEDPRAMDLENSECGVFSTIQVEAFSNNNLTEARKIMNIACDAMREMGYRRRLGPRRIDNPSGKNIFRVVARFSRFIGDGEQIALFD